MTRKKLFIMACLFVFALTTFWASMDLRTMTAKIDSQKETIDKMQSSYGSKMTVFNHKKPCLDYSDVENKTKSASEKNAENHVTAQTTIDYYVSAITKMINQATTNTIPSCQDTNEPNYCYLPSGNTNWYVYMDAKSITDQSSLQYKYKQLYWLSQSGIWCYGDDYVVAMGTGYADFGDRFRITTECGNDFTVFVGDIKADEHTDDTNRYTPVYTLSGAEYQNVIEFVVDTESLDSEVAATGNLGNYYYIGGRIASIEKLT
jgi:hypothetical protein